jgi:hypothetical protein
VNESVNDKARIRELEIEIANITNQYMHTKAEMNRLNQHIEYLHEEITSHHGVKNQTKGLLLSIDKSISRRIDSLRNNKSKSYDELLASAGPDKSPKQLLQLTRRTDLTVFYNQTRSKQLVYRYVSGSYDLVRAAGKAGIRLGKNSRNKIKRG